MPLAAGARFGPYEVVVSLGAGGMGEVYRARDTRLSRDVALKVLPDFVARDPERLRRFEREARAASAIDHPNVLVVHDVGTEGGVPYVVTELLKGSTLREVLEAGNLTPRRALELSAQVARGLAAAHAAGIVHRDLKPENLFVTEEGRIKVLDFGLAKLGARDIAAGADEETKSHLTAPGLLLGTVAYMSPEQARGLPTDHRTDIFSFGAVLYEMVSGRSAFRAGSTAETLSRILREDPPELEVGLSTTIPGLAGLVRRCLEKRPEDRFHSAHDLALALESLSPASHPSITPPTGHRSRSWLRTVPFWLAPVAAVLAFVAGHAWNVAGTPDTALQMRRLTFRKGAISSARFAPDGATVVYSAAWGDRPTEVFVTRPEALDDRPLGVSPAVVLAVSEQEALVLLRRDTTQPGPLARVPLAGGTPRRVLESALAADFGPGGRDVAAVNVVEGRHRIEFPLGNVIHEAAGDVTDLRVAPSGGQVAFLEQIGLQSARLVVVDRSTRSARTIVTGESMLDVVWASEGTLWTSIWRYGSGGMVQAVDLGGRTRPVWSGFGRLRLRDRSRAGRTVLTHESTSVELYALRPGDARERDLTWLDGTVGSDLALDGRSLLFTERGAGGGPKHTAYFRTLDGAPPTRLREGWAIGLSPDAGRALVREEGPEAPLWLVPMGAGAETQLPLGSLAEIFWAWWSPDRQRILIEAQEPERPVRLFVQTLPSGLPVAVTSEGTNTVWSYPISPDGQQLIVLTRGSRTPYSIQSLGDGTTRPLAGLRPEDTPMRWSGDGRHLFLHTGRQGFPVAIDRLDLRTGQRERWWELPVADPAGMQDIGAGAILLTPDGRTALYHGFRNLADLYLVEGLR